ncbi:24359_t:CDS:2, partial [Gigaspora rosea]
TLVAKYEAGASSSCQELVFSARIASIINSEAWWDNIQKLENLLLPFFFQMSHIRASLLYEECVTQIKKEMFLGQNAALTIYDDQEAILPNDDEDEITDLLNEDSFQNEDDWQRQVDKWNEIIEEEQAQEDEEVYNFDLDIDNIDHPAINNAAKWKLYDLFNNLESPNFLSNL